MMKWPSRFVAVSPNRLRIVEELKPSSKASPDELREYVRNVPRVYELLRDGVTREQFETARTEGRGIVSRDLGDSYYYCFSAEGREGRIEAEYVSGDLLVTRGRHRVDAAQREGVAYLPVHVKASSEEMLALVLKELQSGPAAPEPAIVEIHRSIDDQHADFNGNRPTGRLISRKEATVSFEGEMSRRTSPEFEPQPRENRATPDRDRAERALGALATAKEVQSPAAARQERISRSLGNTATEAARASSATPNRERS